MWGNRLFVTVVTAFSLLGAFTSRTTAADILVGEAGTLLIVGRIEVGDDEKFRRTVLSEIRRPGRHDPVGSLYVYSPGGHFNTALNIGEQVHLLQLETVAPRQLSDGARVCDLPGDRERRDRVSAEKSRHMDAMIKAMKAGKIKSYSEYPRFDGQLATFDPNTRRGDARCDCASACFFIWAAGAMRAGNLVGVHRPSFDPAEFSKISPSEARAKYDLLFEASKAYLTKVGISQALINRIFATSSTTIAYLDQQELGKLRRRPHVEELLIAKCGKLTTVDERIDILQRKQAEHPMWKAEAEQYLGRKKCEVESMQEIQRQTNREYVKAYDKVTAHAPPRPNAVLEDQSEAEARKVLKRVLAASRIEGYFIQSRGELSGSPRHVDALWSIRDPAILGWLRILAPEQDMGVEQAAAWVAAGASKSCGDLKRRFVQSPLRRVQGGARMMTACEYEGIRDGGHYTFISRKDGGLYLFATVPAGKNQLEASGRAHDKLSDAAIAILGTQSR